MFLAPWLDSIQWVKANGPHRLFQRKRLNFIKLHYLYIILMTIIGSILIYPAGNLRYIDALFFASGLTTQSGLNTVDVNKLNTYQQVVMFFLPMFCTPIFIHSFVVFIRLYWFERKFQKIVKDARHLRRSRSFQKPEPRDPADLSATENGIRGKSIVVLHNKPTLGAGRARDFDKWEEAKDSGTSSESGQPADVQDQPAPFHRDITFADEIPRRGRDTSDSNVLPQQVSPEQHIAIRENQRNPKDKSALRIPGPRDFDRGSEPQPLHEQHADGAETTLETITSNEDLSPAHNDKIQETTSPEKSDVTRTRSKTDTATFPKLSKPRSDLRDISNAPTEDIAPLSARLKARAGTFSSLNKWASKDNEPVAPYLSWQPTIGRNSAFMDLTEEQREELGGIEYRSLKTLAVVLVSYYWAFHLLGVIVLLPWIMRTGTWRSVVEEAGVRSVWWGIFSPASLFNDLGYTLTPDSFQSFQKAILPLIFGSFLIIIGNTGFPCMLRFVIWIASKMTKPGSPVWDEFRFLLDHPRRCFTLLFPAVATWWLFWILVLLNGVDIIFFIILDLNDDVVNSINPSGYRVLNGLFQAASTRTAGFASVNLAKLHPGIQVSYLVMMYISVFPTAISMRRTNVYEENSLGIYTSTNEDAEDEKEPSYVGAHLRKQLSFDLWYIFLGLFIIAIAEGKHLENTNEYAFTIFSVLFEIVSAYGTVGLSLGYPDVNASFTSQFTVVSKLVIIAMEIRGRHRGLPYELDRAILLPSDKLHNKDADAGKRLHRRNSTLGAHAPGGLMSRASTLARTPTSNEPPPHPTDVANASGTDVLRDQEKDANPHHSGHLRRGVGRLIAGVADRS